MPLSQAALDAIGAASDTAALKAARSAHAAEGSPLAHLNARLRDVAPEHKAEFGKLVGQARARVNQALAARESELAEAETAARLEAERIDVTALAARARVGARHPISLLQEQVADIFVGMGWEIAEGPELEHEWFNFDALNFDVDHPARQMQDTFFVDPRRPPPRDAHAHEPGAGALDARARACRSTCSARGGSTAPTSSTRRTCRSSRSSRASSSTRASRWRTSRAPSTTPRACCSGPRRKTRFRANYFPFTEPSAELDLWHPTFKGGARWIEWGGCGMVNPNVLRAAGIDPEEYSGFAFGMGIERTLMFRSDVQDMRDMAEGDVRFSEQFGMVV